MGTRRIGPIYKSSPSTGFAFEADWVEQSGQYNWSKLRVVLVCWNTGNTTSYNNDYGEQYAWWGGGELAARRQSPFLPGGYAYNQTRWADVHDHLFYHDSNGNLGQIDFGMRLDYGSVDESHYGNIGGPARIPKPPTVPRNVSVSGIEPKLATISWIAPEDSKGSAINKYEVAISPNPDMSGELASPEVSGSTYSYQFTTLAPATYYYYRVRAGNGSYNVWGPWSAVQNFKTKSGGYVGKGGSFLGGEILVGKGGSFVNAEVLVGKSGSFVNAG